MIQEAVSELTTAADFLHIGPKNSTFVKSGDFISLTVKNECMETVYKRVYFHRIFPNSYPYGYISVMDSDSAEIGIIEDINIFPEETASLIKKEIDRKYYIIRLKAITSVKDRRGFSFWKAVSEDGDVSFTVRDTYRNITKIYGGNILICDIDGNRYELPGVNKLDKKSRKKIEIYL